MLSVSFSLFRSLAHKISPFFQELGMKWFQPTKYKSHIHYRIESLLKRFQNHCSDGDIDSARAIFSTSLGLSHEQKKKCCLDMIVNGFNEACKYGQPDVVEYLLKQGQKEKLLQPSRVQAMFSDGMSWACLYGNISVLKTLLAHPLFKEPVFSKDESKTLIDECFRVACNEGKLEVVKFLLQSPFLPSQGHGHADVHSHNDKGFHQAAYAGRHEVVSFLVLDYKIEQTAHIKDSIKSFPHIQKLFSMRELNDTLEEHLPVTSRPVRKKKI